MKLKEAIPMYQGYRQRLVDQTRALVKQRDAAQKKFEATGDKAWEEEAALNMPDEREILYRTVEKKYAPDTELDEKEMRRLQGYLIRRGFSYPDIKSVLESMNIRAADQW